ncbi:MAG: hypothetical protein ABEK75_10930 [Salinibacter sp.]
MMSSSPASSLDSPPDAEVIAELRTQASAQGESVEVTFPTADGETKRFVVSPRGTCVVLQDTREDSFNPSVAPEEVAASLRENSADA